MQNSSSNHHHEQSSMLNLLPMPIVYTSFLSAPSSSSNRHRSAHQQSVPMTTTRLSMASSSRLIPGGSLDYESKVKRITYSEAKGESFEATKKMDALFTSSTMNEDGNSDTTTAKNTTMSSSFSSSPLPQFLIDRDSLVIRVLYAGGFTEGSFEDFGKNLPSAKSSTKEAQDQSKMQNFSMTSGSGQTEGENKHSSSSASGATSSNKSTKQKHSAKPDIDLFAAHTQSNSTNGDTNNTNNSSSNKTNTTTPGLSFVGRVVFAGKNVHFLNEWIPDPDTTSILPRGFKEGDLVCGLQCDKSWLRGEPLRGTVGTYVVVPACFVMRMSTSSAPSSSSSWSNVVNYNNLSHQILAGNLLSSVLWYSLFRWHIEPKSDESVLIVCVKRDFNNKMVLAASSTSLLNPVVGATILKLKFSTTVKSISIVCNCEEDWKQIKKFENNFVVSSSPKSSSSNGEETKLFENIIDLSNDHDVKKELFKSKFHHIIVCENGTFVYDSVNSGHDTNNHDDDESNDEASSHQSDDDEDENLNDDEVSIEEVLVKCLHSNGTIAYMNNRVDDLNLSSSGQKSQAFISNVLLPLTMSKSGRLVFMTTKTLFDSPSERVRRSIAEVVGLFLGNSNNHLGDENNNNNASSLIISPPTRVIKPDQNMTNKVLEPLLRQLKMFLQATTNSSSSMTKGKSNKQEQIDEQDDNAAEVFSREVEWRQLADKTGTLVAEMLTKNLNGLCSLLTNRKRQQYEAFKFENNHHDKMNRVAVMMNDVSFEKGLNSLVVQFP